MKKKTKKKKEWDCNLFPCFSPPCTAWGSWFISSGTVSPLQEGPHPLVLSLITELLGHQHPGQHLLWTWSDPSLRRTGVLWCSKSSKSHSTHCVVSHRAAPKGSALFASWSLSAGGGLDRAAAFAEVSTSRFAFLFPRKRQEVLSVPGACAQPWKKINLFNFHSILTVLSCPPLDSFDSFK